MTKTRETKDSNGDRWTPSVPGNDAHCNFMDKGVRGHHLTRDQMLEQAHREATHRAIEFEDRRWRLANEFGEDAAEFVAGLHRRSDAEARLRPLIDYLIWAV